MIAAIGNSSLNSSLRGKFPSFFRGKEEAHLIINSSFYLLEKIGRSKILTHDVLGS
jgi:hypothetical protein